MIDAHFIYCPTSGSKLLTAEPDVGLTRICDTIWVCKYSNRSMHVFGGVCLSTQAAIPGNYFREQARATAVALAGENYVAVDEKGCVSVIVPSELGWNAWQYFSILPLSWEDKQRNFLSLVLGGSAVFHPPQSGDGGLFEVSGRSPTPEPWEPKIVGTGVSGIWYGPDSERRFQRVPRDWLVEAELIEDSHIKISVHTLISAGLCADGAREFWGHFFPEKESLSLGEAKEFVKNHGSEEFLETNIKKGWRKVKSYLIKQRQHNPTNNAQHP